MATLGFPEDAFVGVVTSGEIAHLRLQNRSSGGWFWEELGSRCLHMTWSERGAISLDGLSLDVRLCFKIPLAFDSIELHEIVLNMEYPVAYC